MFRAKVGGPEKQSSSSSPGCSNPDGPGVWRGTEWGKLPSGVTLYLAAAMCKSAAVLSPLSGETTSPQVASQLSPRGTCLAFAGKDKTVHKINGEVYFKWEHGPREQGRGLDALA